MNPYRTAAPRPREPFDYRSVAAAFLCAFGAMLFTGCVNGKLSPAVAPIVTGLEQTACTIAEVLDPSAGTYIGSVCSIAQPVVSSVLSGLSASKRAAVSAATCKLTPITATGTTALGVVCDSICGDLSKASASDPCPAVDARLASGK